MEIQLLGAHNLETRDTRHTCFLIDGRIAIDAGSLVTGLTPEELENVRALLLTHHHFDHIRDVPTLGLVRRDARETLDLWGLPATLAGVHDHVMDGNVYPDLTKRLNEDPPRFRARPLKPWATAHVDGYQIKVIPVPHPVPAVGYIIRADSSGNAAPSRSIGLTGDTGGDLMPFLRDPLSPEVLFIDMTFPNRLRELAKLTGHLTPGLLREQAWAALQAGLRVPKLVAVHRGLGNEEELLAELSIVRGQLGIDLIAGYPGMVV